MIDAKTAGLKTGKKDIVNLVKTKTKNKMEELQEELSSVLNESEKLRSDFYTDQIQKLNVLIKKNKLNFKDFSPHYYSWDSSIIYPEKDFPKLPDKKIIHKSLLSKFNKINSKMKELTDMSNDLISNITLYGVSPEIIKMIEKAFK